jgi:microcystin degradation protein MlrC
VSGHSIRIAVLHFSHETVTFLQNDTTLEDFIYPGSPAKGDALLGFDPKSYMGGFVKMAREFDGVELVGIESPLWPKTGTGSGWVTGDAYETFVGKMIAEIRANKPFHGVYLCLHGAMAVRGISRPEAELARRIREAVGPGAFIAATFDLHGNEDGEFLRHADMAFAVKYFPHYDGYLQGERAARTLVRAIRGDYKPSHSTVKVPIISPTVVQWTGASPWMDLTQRALIWEASEPDVYVKMTRRRRRQPRDFPRWLQANCTTPASYSITRSARASIVGGGASPSAFAVLRLITRANLVGCSIGRSAASAPLKILST